MRTISDRQRRILEFIASFQQKHGYPPTVREIGQEVGISSTSVVDYNLRALEKSGYLRRDREVSRGLELTGAAANRVAQRPSRIPIMGRIAAGEPIEAVQGHAEEIELPQLLSSSECYALQVKGRSMVEDLIDDGDLVVIRPQESADDGEIVVALLTDGPTPEGRATLKRLYREKGRIRLQPANSAMNPIYVDSADLRVQGKVVAVIRQL
ncbi:MAG: transcriptional repressor LexA [Chloroflexota bacterium]|jgi:repressor LexA